MLDQQLEVTQEEAVVATEGEEAPQEEEVVIAIEGEPPEVDEDAEIEAELGDKGRNALRAAREAAKAASRKVRDLETRLAAQEQPKQEPELKRPTLEDCGFNEDTFAEQMSAYLSAKKDADAKREAEAAKVRERETAYQEKLNRYHAERIKVGVDDDAQAVVVAALNAQQQTALMDASSDPAKVVAVLSKTHKILSESAGIAEIHKFTYRLDQIEGRITMTEKAPPPPESKLRGAGAPPSASLSSQLEAAEKRAEMSGDRSAVLRIKRQMREAGVKA